MSENKIIDNVRMDNYKMWTRYFERYNNHEISDDVLFRIAAVYGNNEILLPSSRVGNALALALETKEWYIAGLLIDNMFINTDTISYMANGEDPISTESWMKNYQEKFPTGNEKELFDHFLCTIFNRDKTVKSMR